MKHTLNRLFCLFLCAVMVLGMVPAVTASAETTTVEREVDIQRFGGYKDGNPVFYNDTATITREIPAEPIRKGSAATADSAKKAITENEYGSIYFTTFADLKKLAERTFSEWTSVYYEGEGDLVISENLTLPDNMALKVDDAAVIINKGVTLTTGDKGNLYLDELNVKGTLKLNTYLSVDDKLTVTGKISANDSIYLEPDTVVSGIENVTFTESWCGFEVEYDVSSVAEIKTAIAAAKNNPSFEYNISFSYDAEDRTFTSSLTFPANTYFSCWGSYPLTINSGVTVTFNGSAGIGVPMVVKGKLVNNDRIYYYGSSLQFTSTGSYSGSGYLEIDPSDDNMTYTDVLSGLDTENLEIVENYSTYSDGRQEPYWVIRDVTGLTRLGAPKSLTWNKVRTWNVEEQKYELTTQYGSVSWKPGTVLDLGSEYTMYYVTLYCDGEPVYRYSVGYNNDYLAEGNYMSADLSNGVDMESGEYYFTIQAQAQSPEYYDSTIVKSSTWTYTKPSTKSGKPTNLRWDGLVATWDRAQENNYAHRVQIYYSATKDGEKQQIGSTWGEMIGCEISSHLLEDYGPGYYYFKVRTLSSNITKRTHSAWSSMSKAYHYTGDEKPDAPTITAYYMYSSGKPYIEWQRSPGANKYRIYRATSKTGTYKYLDTVEYDYDATWFGYEDESASVNKRYYYKVRAISYTGKYSGYSNADSMRCILAQPKVSISGNSSTGKPVVKWDTVKGAEKYYIYRSTKQNSGYTRVATAISARSYTDTEAKVGTKYYYKVKAIHENSAANSEYSAVVSRVCDLKRPSVTLKLSTSGYPYLKWSEISGASKYYVYRATSKTGTYKMIKSTTAEKFTDKDVTSGKTYYYKVKAVHSNTAANSAYSAIKSIKAK